MGMRAIFRRVNPFAGVASMFATGAVLVTAIFFTWFDLPWVAFLSGILLAAAIALLNRLTYAEETLESLRESVRYFDEELPVMIAYVNAEGVVQVHNQAFRYWLHARREAINGRHLRDVVGMTTFAQMKAGFEAALAGRLAQETRTHELRGGQVLRLFTEYVPHAGEEGPIVGAFIVQTDITALEGAPAKVPPGVPVMATSPAVVAGTAPDAAVRVAANASASAGVPNGGDRERLIFVDTMREELTDWVRAGDRLRAALDNDEFCLFCQAIAPVSTEASGAPFYEMLLRLREEEEGLMPPGAFLPLAEEYGLLPELDRWVVKSVLDWAGAMPARQASRYSINVSAPTLVTDGFAEFVAGELRKRGLQGALLCFEIQEADALVNRVETTRLVTKLSEAGCGTILCGFGKTAASYGLLKLLKVDFLKIDGDIVLGLVRNPMDRIKLKAIARVARSTNRRTIAEFVESDETMALLREYGVDYAQGFGIARPAPLADLT